MAAREIRMLYLHTRKVLHSIQLPIVLCLMVLCGGCFSLTTTFTTTNENFTQSGDSQWTVGTPSLKGLITAQDFNILSFPGIRVTYQTDSEEFINCLFSLAANSCDKIVSQCTEATNYNITCKYSGSLLTVNMHIDTLIISKNNSRVSIVLTTAGLIPDWTDQVWTIILRYCNISAIDNIKPATGNAEYDDTLNFNCLDAYTPDTISGTCTSNFNCWVTTGNCTPKTTTTTAAAATMISTDIVDTDSTTTKGNNTDTTNGSDSSLTTATTSSNTTKAPNPPLPGWAIFLIILGALVLVFAVLFIVWWCVPGFRECLHGVSECFPEDHCCGKGSKDINEETTQKAAQVEDDL